MRTGRTAAGRQDGRPDPASGRDNNFNLVRMVAATAVLVSHAWLIALGPAAGEPLKQTTGHTMGVLAVFVFFAISGYFITASFDRARSAGDFVLARALRLLPGLIVCTLLSALVMGPLVTAMAPGAYLADARTWEFVLRNSVPISHVFRLPGVFETNPHPIVAGAIWTLPNETACYVMVFLAGIAGLIRRRSLLTALIAVYAALWILTALQPAGLPPRAAALRLLSFPFVAGMALYLWRYRVTPSAAWVAGLALLTALAWQTFLQDAMLILTLTFLAFWLGRLPSDLLQRYNRLGDYSYGTYLYAFPVQGLMVWAFGPMGPWMNIALALPLTLALAILSWRLVEKPALALRRRRPDR